MDDFDFLRQPHVFRAARKGMPFLPPNGCYGLYLLGNLCYRHNELSCLFIVACVPCHRTSRTGSDPTFSAAKFLLEDVGHAVVGYVTLI
jgi:hypothetical protein